LKESLALPLAATAALIVLLLQVVIESLRKTPCNVIELSRNTDNSQSVGFLPVVDIQSSITQLKLAPALGNPTPVMKMKQGESVIRLLFRIIISTTISIKRSRWELSIDMVIHRVIFKINQIKFFACVT